MSSNITYGQGLEDAIRLYGEVCGRQANCDECVIGKLKGSEITCQEFMSKFPSKMVSMLTEMSSKEYTYYDEFNTRFPNCNLSLEDLSEVTCRKALFEGFVACEGGDCKACWSEKFVGDITESYEEDSEEETE